MAGRLLPPRARDAKADVGIGKWNVDHEASTEEAEAEGARRRIITALAVTGGVITSAGILLAAVFAVLRVLPLITLTKLGVVVGFGVLLGSLLVRTVHVPALVTVAGDRFWWPESLWRRSSHGRAAAQTRGDVSKVGTTCCASSR